LRLRKDRRLWSPSTAAASLSPLNICVRSPSAGWGHSPDERKTVGGKRNVAIAGQSDRQYAVRSSSTTCIRPAFLAGIISRTQRNRERYWQDYLDERRQGLER
jgi:DUF971 family protein